ncbi:MAG TPA: TonB family protein [Longimicrobiaceae bacterium]|nr:TonB family protein [Longimicrobiaceae bacterium]
MFSKLDSRTRRSRILSPAMLAVSVGAHVLLLGGVLIASSGERARPLVLEIPIEDYFPAEVEPRPVPPPPMPPEPVAPPQDTRPPVPGDFVNPVPPDDIPRELPKYSPSDAPLTPDMTTGSGKPGDVIGPRVPGDDRPPTGETRPVPPDGVHTGDVVEERPALRNTAEMQQVLQRMYPELLRDAGIAGQTQLRFVVDAEGRVEPGSVTVVSATHPGVEAPSLRAAERFRFRPAKIGGRGVRVVISMPITWKLDGN